jgi:hypothetical protein
VPDNGGAVLSSPPPHAASASEAASTLNQARSGMEAEDFEERLTAELRRCFRRIGL